MLNEWSYLEKLGGRGRNSFVKVRDFSRFGFVEIFVGLAVFKVCEVGEERKLGEVLVGKGYLC